MHPRVYLPIQDAPDHEITCPYCGARYRLED
ncbi:zinc-finger domain-containing protein [Thiococcus pfennigii]